MATQVGEIEVKLSLNAADFRRVMGQSKESLEGFSGAATGLMGELARIFTFAAIAEFFKKSIDAYDEQEVAISKLVRALENHGIASDQTVGHLKEMAMQFEKLTGVEDTQILAIQGTMTSFGLQGAQMDRATKAALDLSAGLGIDLNQAAMLISKAFEGNTTMLSRYGLKISEAIEPTQKFATALKLIEEKFGGQAEAQLDTFAGKLKLLGDAFKHLEEEVGQLIAGKSGGLVAWVKQIVDSVTQAVHFLNQIRQTTSSFTALLQGTVIVVIQAVMNHMLDVLSFIINISSHLPIIGAQIAKLKPQIDIARMALQEINVAEKQTFLQGLKTTAGAIDNEHKKTVIYHNAAQEHMDVDAALNAWIAKQRLLDHDAFMADLKERDVAYRNFIDTMYTTESDLWDEATRLRDTFTQGFSDGFAKMIVEGKNFGDSLKAVFQDLAEQVISYIMQMIVKMLILLSLESAAGMGPAGGVMFGGFAGAMADGGVIAEPSIITGLRSGRQILAGESGPEMVMPMGGMNQTAAEMGGLPGSGGGGQSITINISGQFIDGDSNSWNRLMRDRIIPEIRRFTMSSPTGPFNRSRGVT